MSKNSFATLIALVAVMSVGWIGCGKKNGASGGSGDMASDTPAAAPASAASAIDGARAVDPAMAAASPPAPANSPNSAKPFGVATAPPGQAVLALWKEGDRVKAIDRFVATDWKTQPLFAADSVLSLSEAQFAGLPRSDLEAKQREMMEQITPLKQLASAVAQAGIDAAARNDTAAANKHFNALKECGHALDNPDSLKLLRLVGKGIEKRADTELSKLPQ
jgi:hypothetical protein